ncbi:MAG: hypothetical protein ACP5QP_06230 [Brevinematia bacterium]
MLIKLINRLKLLGFVNFLISFIVSVILVVFLFSFFLYLLDVDNFFIPTIFILIFILLFLLLFLFYLILNSFNFFVLNDRKIELLIFSSRKFIIDSVKEIYKKGEVPESYLNVEEVEKGISSFIVKFTKLFLFLVFVLLVISLSFHFFLEYKLKDFFSWIMDDVKMETSKFVSSDIPLSLSLIPSFSGKFFISVDDNLSPIANTNGCFYFSTKLSKNSVVKVFSKKYGMYKFVRKLDFNYVDEFTLLSQKVEVYFKNFKISSYDYIPQISVVKGSIIKLFFSFSYNVSKVNLSGVKGGVWNYQDVSNKVLITMPISKDSKVNFNFYDELGRVYRVENFYVSVRTNDIPTVVIKYPEKDMVFNTSKVILDGYGEVIDNDELISTWMEVTISNAVNGFVSSYVVNNKNLGFSFKGIRDFSFSFESSEVGVLPGDYVNITVFSKDIYGAIGSAYRVFYFPTFAQLAKSFQDKLNSTSNEVSKYKEELSKLEFDLNNRNNTDFSKLSEKLLELKNFVSNLSSYSSELKEIYQHIDRTKSLYEEFQKLENISKKLEEIISDKEFNDIIKKLSSDRAFSRDEVKDKIENVLKELTKLEMEVNKISEFRDIIKSISEIRELERISKDVLENRSLNEFDEKLRKFLDSQEFNKMSEDFKTSFKEKVKRLRENLKKQETNKESLESNFKDLDFEIFKEVMKQLSELSRKQREKFWDIYFKVLSSQVSLTKSKDNIEVLSYRFPKIENEMMEKDFKNISDAIKDFKLAIKELISTFSKDPEVYEVFSEIQTEVRDVEMNFNLFTDAVSSGSSYSLILSISEIANRMSNILFKMLDLLDKMNEGINVAPSGVSLNQLIEMYKEIARMLSEMVNQGDSDRNISKLESMLKEAVQKASDLEAKNPGDGRAKQIREELEDILNKVREGKLKLALEKSKVVDFNLLEYQRGMFEKGLSEKREAERPKKYSIRRVNEFIENLKPSAMKDSYIMDKYFEIMNKYKKLIVGD